MFSLENHIEIYLIFSIIIILLIFIGPERNGKIIIINFFLLIISLALINSIELLTVLLDKTPENSIGKIDEIQTFFINNKKWIATILYILLFFFSIYSTKINIGTYNSRITRFISSLLLAPIALLIVLINVETLIIGTKILNFPELIEKSRNLENEFIKNFVFFSPAIILISGIIFIIITSNLGFKINFKRTNKGIKKFVGGNAQGENTENTSNQNE